MTTLPVARPPPAAASRPATDARAAGFSLIELLLVCALVGILGALSAPFLMAAKTSSNEASAIGSLRAVNSAQATFFTTCGRQAYAAALADLISGDFLSADMGFNPKAGYNFALAAGAGGVAGPPSCLGGATMTTYYASGTPLAATTGSRAFATSPIGTIWERDGAVAPAEPFSADPAARPIQ